MQFRESVQNNNKKQHKTHMKITTWLSNTEDKNQFGSEARKTKWTDHQYKKIGYN